MAIEFTPWVDGVTQYKAAQMNAPLVELMESAQDECDAKAELEHGHVVADITDFPETLPPSAHEHVVADITDFPIIPESGLGDMLSTNNLSELTDLSDARDNLGLGTAAVADIGTGSDDVAAGDHGHTLDGGIGLGFEATAKPVASDVYSFILPYAMTVPSNCTGSGFYNAANPTAQQTISIKDDGTEIATVTVATNGTPTWATTGGTEKIIAAGRVVSFSGFPTSRDATWAGIAMTLKGARTI